MEKFIVVRENKIIRVYETTGGLDGKDGIKQALKNCHIGLDDVTIIQKLDDFEYAENDMIYPYNPKDKRPEQEIIINPDLVVSE